MNSRLLLFASTAALAAPAWAQDIDRITEKPRTRRLPRWLGGYEAKDEAVRWDPALARLVLAG